MLLTLDVGNTNITLGVFDGEKLLFVSRMATDASRMEDQYAIELRDILHLYGVRRANIDGAIISSVVPKLTEYISHGVEKLFSVKPLTVCYETVKDLLPIAIDQPETTGPDLIAGCAGAKAFFSCPCIVVDLGTATTLAVLDRTVSWWRGYCPWRGCFPGRADPPGRAAFLGQSGGARPCGGRDTAECLQSGVLYGAAAMLDGLCDRMEEELGYPCRVIATGGLAGLVVRHCRRKVECSDTLLLDGLKVIYQQVVSDGNS